MPTELNCPCREWQRGPPSHSEAPKKGRGIESTKTPPHQHKNTTETPPQKAPPPQKHHHITTTKTPPHHHKNTAAPPPQKNTTTPPPQKNTTKAAQRGRLSCMWNDVWNDVKTTSSCEEQTLLGDNAATCGSATTGTNMLHIQDSKQAGLFFLHFQICWAAELECPESPTYGRAQTMSGLEDRLSCRWNDVWNDVKTTSSCEEQTLFGDNATTCGSGEQLHAPICCTFRTPASTLSTVQSAGQDMECQGHMQISFSFTSRSAGQPTMGGPKLCLVLRTSWAACGTTSGTTSKRRPGTGTLAHGNRQHHNTEEGSVLAKSRSMSVHFSWKSNFVSS